MLRAAGLTTSMIFLSPLDLEVVHRKFRLAGSKEIGGAVPSIATVSPLTRKQWEVSFRDLR